MLITSLSVITSILIAFLSMHFIGKILNNKLIVSLKNTIIIIVLGILLYVVHLVVDNTTSVIIIFALQNMVSKIIFKEKLSITIVSTLFYFIILFISDILCVLVATIFKIDPLDMLYAEKTMLGNILVIICILILSKFGIVITMLQKIAYKSNIKIVNYIIFSVITIAAIYMFLYYNLESKGIDDLVINILIIVLLAYMIIKLSLEKINKNNITKEYDKMNEYVKVYEEIIEKDRIRRHENKNQLITIKGMISKKNKKAHDYIDSLIEDNSDKTHRWLGELKNIPIGGLKGLLFYKVNKMRENNIEVSLTISRSLENSKLQNINTKLYKELCQIIGVYVDNAIEACMESENKSIGIEIYKDGDIFEFIITNTYKGNLEVDNIDNAGYTTKGNGHGYGLSLVKDIINTNPQFFQSREMINDYYIQHLFLDLTE